MLIRVLLSALCLSLYLPMASAEDQLEASEELRSQCNQMAADETLEKEVELVGVTWDFLEVDGAIGAIGKLVYKHDFTPRCLTAVGSDFKCPEPVEQTCETKVFCFPEFGHKVKIYPNPHRRCGPPIITQQPGNDGAATIEF